MEKSLRLWAVSLLRFQDKEKMKKSMATTRPNAQGLLTGRNWYVLGVLLVMTSLAACVDSVQVKERALAHLRLGDSMLKEGRSTQALAELIKASELDPDNPLIRNVLGVAYLEKDMIPSAIEQFKKALRLDPEYAEVHNNLGAALLREGKVPEAILELNKALDHPLYPTPHFVQYNLGQAYYQLKDYERSRQHYQKAVKISPAYSLAYHSLGLTFMATGQWDEAAEALKKAIEQAPKFAEAHFDLGEVLLALHQSSLARLAFREVVRLVPEGPLGKKAQQRLKELK
jgi:tetratricopeptide (TPR) repeat protein